MTRSPSPSFELWSTEAKLLFKPFATYRELAQTRSTRGVRDLVRALILQGVLLGVFVSLTSAGRLVVWHILFTAVFWGFLPAIQIGCVAAAVIATAPKERLLPAASLYLDGLAPYYVFYLVLSGICLFAPNVYSTFTTLLNIGVIPLYLLGTIVWGMLVTWAFFREGLGLTRSKTLIASALFYGLFVAIILSYYLALNQIQPQVVGTGA